MFDFYAVCLLNVLFNINNKIINPSIATPLLTCVLLNFYLKLIFVVTTCTCKEFALRGTPLRYAPPSGHPDDTVRLTSVTRITLVVLDLSLWSTMIHAEQSSHSVILPIEL